MIVVQIEGEPIGDNETKVKRIVDETGKSSLKFTVIRESRVVTLRVPVLDYDSHEQKIKGRFISFGGLGIFDLSIEERLHVFEEPGVIIKSVLARHSDVDIFPNTVITAVFIDGKIFPVRDLASLQRALKYSKRNSQIRLKVHGPILADDDKPMEQEGHTILSRTSQIISLPRGALVTERDLKKKKSQGCAQDLAQLLGDAHL